MKNSVLKKAPKTFAFLFILTLFLLPMQGCEMPAEYQTPEGAPPAEEAPPGF